MSFTKGRELDPNMDAGLPPRWENHGIAVIALPTPGVGVVLSDSAMRMIEENLEPAFLRFFNV